MCNRAVKEWSDIVEHTALLSNEDGLTVFEYGDFCIRFAAPYSLEKYTQIVQWDKGYLVVMAKYSHNKTPEEEYIDLIPILEDLYIDKDDFLNKVEEVKLKDD